MPHAVSLISTLAAGFGLALVLGFLAERLKMPALIGYLLAGILIGPATPGFVADADIAAQLAEIGVMLLMFGVGLHFSLADLLAVRKIALPGAVVQMAAATALGYGAARWWGWPTGDALVFGLALSVASTVVLLKALEARNALESGPGRIAVGWLVVEDLAMVLVLVVLPPLAGVLGGTPPAGAADDSLAGTLGKTLAQVVTFIVLMLVVGRRAFPWVLWQVTKTGSRELFTLAVIVAAVTIAYGSSLLFGVSFALGAFFAGMVLRESEFSHRAAEETLPLRDAFAVLFFVSVGMLVDPAVLVERPLHLLGVVAIIMVGKSIAAMALVLALGYPLRTALVVSASLAQIGEFSFILAGLGMSLGLLSPEARSLIVAGALISIALNPLLFDVASRLADSVATGRPRWLGRLQHQADPLSELPPTTHERYLARHVVIVGYGRVGKRIAETLAAAGIPFVVADENREAVERLRQDGVAAVYGNATDSETLIQAHIANARMLVIATPETIEVRQMVQTARTLNPSIEVAVRSHNSEEAALLEAEGTGRVFVGESELAAAMSRHVEGAVTSPAPKT
ncbi:MAG TPA: YbaL family putative K(+) efflux transporter [Caldimonas sp.]|jgi:CPA2 family monovalent cation:H+ antiporter-2|nr:YbaL family putative K(+) efflux transporter [Caldimonas sp.]HEX2540706.1 YbaL family putative K(+) efflux transporter [Caldimonas sp.]